MDDLDDGGGVRGLARHMLHIGATARDETHESVAKLVCARKWRDINHNILERKRPTSTMRSDLQ